jgi:hypothetical protein
MSDPFATESLPATEPSVLVIGRFAAWRRRSDVSPFTASLVYRTKDKIIFGTPNNDGHWRFDVSSALSGTLTAEKGVGWSLIAVREADDEEMELARGVWDFVATNADRRSHAEITLDKIKAMIEGRADDDVMNYTIAGRSVGKMSPSELIEWRNHYEAEVAAEKAAASGVQHRTVRVVIR